MRAGWRDLVGWGADRAWEDLDPEAEVVRQIPRREEEPDGRGLGEDMACPAGRASVLDFPRQGGKGLKPEASNRYRHGCGGF